MQQTIMTPREQLADFAGIVWGPDSLIEVRCLPANRDGGLYPESFWMRADELAGRSDKLAALNAGGQGIHAGVLPRAQEGGSKDADCQPGLVVWADFDDCDPRGAWRRASEAGLPNPSMAISSGHGGHLYWRLTELIEPGPLCGLVGDLAAMVGADQAVKNPSRLMRLPGFQNLKEPVAPCTLLYSDSERLYDFATLRACVPEPEPERIPRPAAAMPGGTHGGADVIERARKYVDAIDAAAEGGRNHEAFRVAAILLNDFGLGEGEAWPILCGWNARNNPPLSEPELQAVCRSGGKYGKQAHGVKANAPRTEPARQSVRISTDTTSNDALANMRMELDAQESGKLKTIALPWKRLSGLSNALRPGTVVFLAGPSGVGKSFFAATIAKGVNDAGETWRYLPLEDRRVDLQWRFAAMLAGSYRMIDEDREGANLRRKQLALHSTALEGLAASVCENPRVGHKDAAGKTVVPALPHSAVLDWIGEALAVARVVFIDPISQIEFDGRETHRAEADFVRRTTALARDNGGTVVLVAHTIKRPGKGASIPLTLEDVQGSAMLGRLCQCGLILDAHERRETIIYRAGGLRETVSHNRTLIIAKARNASGTRQRIAFEQDSSAPVFHELGIIAPKD